MAIADEMQAAGAVHLDRRDRRAAPFCQRQLLPAGPHPVGGGPEVPVEVAPRVDRADDRVQPYRLQAHVPLAAHAERAGDLVERQEAVAVTGLAAQAVRQPGQDLAPPGPGKVVLGVCAGESGIEHRAASVSVTWPGVS